MKADTVTDRGEYLLIDDSISDVLCMIIIDDIGMMMEEELVLIIVVVLLTGIVMALTLLMTWPDDSISSNPTIDVKVKQVSDSIERADGSSGNDLTQYDVAIHAV